MSSGRLVLFAFVVATGHPSVSSAQDDSAIDVLALAWEYPTPRELPQAIVADALDRPVLYVAMKNGGLLVLDAASRDRPPRELARVGVEAFHNLHVMHLTQSGEWLYLALGEFFNANGAIAGLAVVNVKDARQPKVSAVWKSDEVLKGSAIVVVDGGFAYLGAMTAGVMIFDVSEPGQLERISVFQPDIHFPRRDPGKVQHPNARGLAVRDNLLFVAYDAGGLRVLDVSDRRAPREVGRYINAKMPNKQQAYNNVVLDGNLAYVAVDYAGLEILDIRDPRNIRQVGWWNPWNADTLKNLWLNSPGHTNQIAFDAKHKRVWLSAGGSQCQVVDVSRPARPRLAARYGEPGDKLGVWGITVADDRAYLSYVTAILPFRGTWAGIKAVRK